MNYEARAEKVKRINRSDDIQNDQWHELVDALPEGESTGRRMTRAATRPNLDALRQGSKIWIDVEATKSTGEKCKLRVRGVVSIKDEKERLRIWNATPPQNRQPRNKPSGNLYSARTEFPDENDEVDAATFIDCELLETIIQIDRNTQWSFRGER